MLKRTVLEAATKADKKEENGDNVFRIGLTIDEEVIEKIREGKGERLEVVEDEGDEEEKKKAYWAPLLPAVLWAYRCTPHVKTGMSPAMLAFGTELRTPFD